MNGTDGIRTQEECLFSDAKRALSPRRSVSLQRFFRKRCAKYHEIRFACVRSCRRTARTSAKDGPTKDGEGRTPSPPYRILCLRTETHADIAHDDGIKAHVCRCMRRIGIATARRPLLRIHRRKGTKRGRVVKTLPESSSVATEERRSPLFENLVGHLTALHGPGTRQPRRDYAGRCVIRVALRVQRDDAPGSPRGFFSRHGGQTTTSVSLPPVQAPRTRD